jgi:hypothetical protein
MADRLPASIVERTRRGSQLPDWLERMTEGRSELEYELELARESDVCREVLDLDRIGRALADWPSLEQNRTRPREVARTYRFAVFRGLLMARYVRFFGERVRDQRQWAEARAR